MGHRVNLSRTHIAKLTVDGPYMEPPGYFLVLGGIGLVLVEVASTFVAFGDVAVRVYLLVTLGSGNHRQQPAADGQQPISIAYFPHLKLEYSDNQFNEFEDHARQHDDGTCLVIADEVPADPHYGTYHKDDVQHQAQPRVGNGLLVFA